MLSLQLPHQHLLRQRMFLLMLLEQFQSQRLLLRTRVQPRQHSNINRAIPPRQPLCHQPDRVTVSQHDDLRAIRRQQERR